MNSAREDELCNLAPTRAKQREATSPFWTAVGDGIRGREAAADKRSGLLPPGNPMGSY